MSRQDNTYLPPLLDLLDFFGKGGFLGGRHFARMERRTGDGGSNKEKEPVLPPPHFKSNSP